MSMCEYFILFCSIFEFLVTISWATWFAHVGFYGLIKFLTIFINSRAFEYFYEISMIKMTF